MPYIGRGLTGGRQYQKLDDPSLSNDAFTMKVATVAVTPPAEHLIIGVNGVIQEPTVGFTVSGSTCTFTGTVTGSDDVWGVVLGEAAYPNPNSIGATELKVSGDGSSGQYLSSDADGTFSWVTAASPAITSSTNSTDNAVALYNGTGNATLDSSANLTFDGSTLALTGDLNVGSGDFFVDDSTGEVGIGTASPGTILQVGDTDNTYIGSSSSNTINFGYGQTGDDYAGWLNFRGYQDGTTKYRDLRIGDGKGGTVVFVDGSSGNVGIGTTSPGTTLDVSGTFNVTGIADFGHDIELNRAARTTIYATVTNQAVHIKSNGTGSLQFNNDSAGDIDMCVGGGNVGIGTTNPGAHLDVTTNFTSGTNTYVALFSTSNDNEFIVNGDGRLYAFDTWQTSWSDRSLKENIKPILSGIDVVKKLNPVTFEWKKSVGLMRERTYYGLIAQELKEVLPDLVYENKRGILNTQKDELQFILIKAIQELSAKVEALEGA